MANVMPISGNAAGTVGSPYLTKITSANIGTGNYLFTPGNFPGITPYIPGTFLMVAPVTTANMTIGVSTDNGSSWVTLQPVSGYVFIDQAQTVRLQVTSPNQSIFMYPMGSW